MRSSSWSPCRPCSCLWWCLQELCEAAFPRGISAACPRSACYCATPIGGGSADETCCLPPWGGRPVLRGQGRKEAVGKVAAVIREGAIGGSARLPHMHVHGHGRECRRILEHPWHDAVRAALQKLWRCPPFALTVRCEGSVGAAVGRRSCG